MQQHSIEKSHPGLETDVSNVSSSSQEKTCSLQVRGRVPRIPRPASARRNPNLNMFPASDRLYADHFRKQELLKEQRRIKELEMELATQQVYCTPISQALAAHRTASGYSSYGERLYLEGKMDALRREEQAKYIREKVEELELAEATFKPQISKMAQQLKKREFRHSSSHPNLKSSNSSGSSLVSSCNIELDPQNAWERLYNTSKRNMRRQARLDAIRRENEEDELRECSFKPTINKQSDALITERRKLFGENVSKLPTCVRLYADHQQRASKKETQLDKLDTECTFNPQINSSKMYSLRRMTDENVATSSINLSELQYSKIVNGFQCENVKHRTEGVVSRLLKKGEEYRRRKESAQHAYMKPKDPVTGEEYFHPQTFRPPKKNRNPENIPIGEYLYSLGDKYSKKNSKYKDLILKKDELDRSRVYVNPVSERIMESLRFERLRAIFAYLVSGNKDSSFEGHDSGSEICECGSITARSYEVDRPLTASSEVECDSSLKKSSETSFNQEIQNERIDLLATVQNNDFMCTIDPEVRADIEHAADLLVAHMCEDMMKVRKNDGNRRSHMDSSHLTDSEDLLNDTKTRLKSETGDNVCEYSDALLFEEFNPRSGDAGIEIPAEFNSMDLMLASDAPDHTQTGSQASNHADFRKNPKYTSSIINESEFIDLMLEVLQSTKGIVRQYLLPMPSYRKKWEDPSFHPHIDPASKRLAARKRPAKVAAYEILYRDAEVIANKMESKRKEKEKEAISKFTFKPSIAPASRSAKGKAFELAQEWKDILAERTRSATMIKAEKEAEILKQEMEEAAKLKQRRETWRLYAERHRASCHSDEEAYVHNLDLLVPDYRMKTSGHNSPENGMTFDGENHIQTLKDSDNLACWLASELTGGEGVMAAKMYLDDITEENTNKQQDKSEQVTKAEEEGTKHQCITNEIYVSSENNKTSTPDVVEDMFELDNTSSISRSKLEDGIEIIENQIKEAMERLSLSNKTVMANWPENIDGKENLCSTNEMSNYEEVKSLDLAVELRESLRLDYNVLFDDHLSSEHN